VVPSVVHDLPPPRADRVLTWTGAAAGHYGADSVKLRKIRALRN
jgi:hypothetical protein